MRGNAPKLFFGALAVAACAVFLMSDVTIADASPLPGGKMCMGDQCDLLRKPDRRILPAGVMFARTWTIAVANDANPGAKAHKQKRSAKKEARKDKRAARRANRSKPNTS